jgi:hypothetical protein
MLIILHLTSALSSETAVGLGSSPSSLIQVASCFVKLLVSCFSWMCIDLQYFVEDSRGFIMSVCYVASYMTNCTLSSLMCVFTQMNLSLILYCHHVFMLRENYKLKWSENLVLREINVMNE